MFKYSKDGISVLSVLDARRAKKSGLFPVGKSSVSCPLKPSDSAPLC